MRTKKGGEGEKDALRIETLCGEKDRSKKGTALDPPHNLHIILINSQKKGKEKEVRGGWEHPRKGDMRDC